MEKLTQTNYVDLAEKVIVKEIVRNPKRHNSIVLTTSKIRNLLSLTNTLYSDVIHLTDEILSEEILGKIQYLRLRFVYEAGRDTDREKSVKDFVEKADIIKHLQRIETRSDLLLFCRYMEALVAYHKFNGGRD
ncbi:MAG: type III-A CRISPR-associated protein Csm2 [Clostridia bacterium]